MSAKLPLYIVGDPHGHWNPIAAELSHAPPGVVATIGDHDLIIPYSRTVAPILAAGHIVRWLPGNHDLEFGHALLWGDAPEWNLTGRVTSLGGWRIAALGGIFKAKVWYPKFAANEEPQVRTRKEFLARARRLGTIGESGEHGVLETIFPEDIEGFAEAHADILLTHEAPTSHKYGFAALDDLAADLQVSWHVHGHHHKPYSGRTDWGVSVQGLGIGEVWQVPDNV